MATTKTQPENSTDQKNRWQETARKGIKEQLSQTYNTSIFVGHEELNKNFILQFISFVGDGKKKSLVAVAYKPTGFAPSLIHFYSLEPELTIEFGTDSYQLKIKP